MWLCVALFADVCCYVMLCAEVRWCVMILMLFLCCAVLRADVCGCLPVFAGVCWCAMSLLMFNVVCCCVLLCVVGSCW